MDDRFMESEEEKEDEFSLVSDQDHKEMKKKTLTSLLNQKNLSEREMDEFFRG